MFTLNEATRFCEWSHFERYWQSGIMSQAASLFEGSISPAGETSEVAKARIGRFCKEAVGGLCAAAEGLITHWSSSDLDRSTPAYSQALAFRLHWTKVALDIVTGILSTASATEMQVLTQIYAQEKDLMIGQPKFSSLNDTTIRSRSALAELRNGLLMLHTNLSWGSTNSLSEHLRRCNKAVQHLSYMYFSQTWTIEEDMTPDVAFESPNISSAILSEASLFRSQYNLPAIPGHSGDEMGEQQSNMKSIGQEEEDSQRERSLSPSRASYALSSLPPQGL